MDEAFRLEALRASDLPTAFGPFQLVRILGQGSMGRVFEATRGGERLALKVIRPATGPDHDTFQKVLSKEAQLGRLLQHPSIVPTREYGEHQGVPWLALDLVDGVDLASILDHWGALPPRVALTIASQLASALDHAHHLQDEDGPTPVVHRDVKPANVLLERGGRARLLDFGIAKAAIVTGLTTADGETRGTPRYMSPEQTRGQPLDGRSDLFGLGVLLYEMLAGERLFAATSLIEVMSMVVSIERTLARPGLFESVEELVPGVGAVIRRCLRADPAQRFSRGLELEQALRPLLEAAMDGPSLEAFARGVLDGPDEDTDTERAEWESFEEHVGLSGAALDAGQILRSVSGEHATLATRTERAQSTGSASQEAAAPTPPEPPQRAQAAPPPKERPPPRNPEPLDAPSRRFDTTEISRGVPKLYPDTEITGIVLEGADTSGGASTPPPGPNPFAEVRRTPPPESPVWWYVVAAAAVLALAVLWFALGR